MGSLTAFKGKDWRAVIVLDVSEGVLPAKSALGTPNELNDLSLLNVGTSRSCEVLIMGFDANAPSRYLCAIQDKLPQLAQVEWDESSVDAEGLYREIYEQRDNGSSDIAWGAATRERGVRVPFKYSWYVVDCTDEIATAGELLEDDDHLVQFSPDVFGKKLLRPQWLASDEVGLKIAGNMGELILLREMRRLRLLSKGGDVVWDAFRRLSKPKGGQEAFFTTNAELLNLVSDYYLNDYWASGEEMIYLSQLNQMLAEHPKMEMVPGMDVLKRQPRCVLHTAHKDMLPNLKDIVDESSSSINLSTTVLWNSAVLLQDMLNQGPRDPGLIKRLLKYDVVPEGLQELVTGLASNADGYIEFKRVRNSTEFSHGETLGLWHTETDESVLQERGFDKKLDARVYREGWGYGIRGRLDFFDVRRSRIVEIKVSGGGKGGGVSPAHEVQTLLYAVLRNRWPVRSFEVGSLMASPLAINHTHIYMPTHQLHAYNALLQVVNLLRGTRYKYVLRKKALMWPIVERALKKLKFDDEMVMKLASLYAPYKWENNTSRTDQPLGSDDVFSSSTQSDVANESKFNLVGKVVQAISWLFNRGGS